MNKCKCNLNRRNSQVISQWSGGSTRQLAIYPNNASGGTDFDYTFEITSSTMDYDETQYTIYYNYRRILMVINDSTILSHADGKNVLLNQYDYDEFDGDCLTFSKGCATDYELMIRKENKGFINTLSLEEGNSQCNWLYCNSSYPFAYHGFFCHQGDCEILVDDEKFLMNDGDQLSIILSNNEEALATYTGRCVLIKSVIYFT